MPGWIFQGNPDLFDLDTYLQENDQIQWSVRQEHLAGEMSGGDELFIWRAAGKAKAVPGVVAYGRLKGPPELMEADEASEGLWRGEVPEGSYLAALIDLQVRCLGAKEVVKRKWLQEDPVLSELRILRMAAETNYRLSPGENRRLRDLVMNTGRDWNREESLAGLWAYVQTLDGSVSKRPGEPVAKVALLIGRAVGGVYNKVMNFRALDPRDDRKGLPAGSMMDEAVWAEYFDAEEESLDADGVRAAFVAAWGSTAGNSSPVPPTYQDFGDAPPDDPEELQEFARRVRKGQPAFRRNLLRAYGERCAISGTGPPEVLEAVHIVPHAESGINELDNGLLLRADLHSLFDAGLLRIEPEGQKVRLSSELEGTAYWGLHGQTIRARRDGGQIGERYLRTRWQVQ